MPQLTSHGFHLIHKGTLSDLFRLVQVCSHVGLCAKSPAVQSQVEASTAASRKLLAAELAAEDRLQDPGQFCQFCQMAVNYIKVRPCAPTCTLSMDWNV
jgi:hypothetical protein